MDVMDDALRARIDHLVYATPDLAATVRDLDRRSGVRAVAGGQHPGRGTRNALIATGPRSYLEIIGPDPDQPPPAGPRWFGIDALTQPRLVTWAANTADLDAMAAVLAACGLGAGPVARGSRTRADGTALSWRYTEPSAEGGEGVIPFLIDWEGSPHPATSTQPQLPLVDLVAEHPEPDTVTPTLSALGLGLVVTQGREPALIATFRTPEGDITLR